MDPSGVIMPVSGRHEISSQSSTATTGFPSPAQDYGTDRINLNRHLIRDEVSTFFLRVTGSAMLDAGIFDGDEIIVDRGIDARHGDIVVAIIDGEFTVKRLFMRCRKITPHTENSECVDLQAPEPSNMRIWGVVTYCLHRVR
ncbi:MAG: translesion error-prone DNA polymerase V autoproteolytic subunit [Propionibacteriaceae bacterium]|jgi:DNA polymerase V|nr:translesion error-prone DNA polymerase V autoproteolytic subunit [Propionibacteriaceae bacterium]